MADLNAASNQINLAAVKRVDPYAKDILEKASQVALYTFNGEKSEWKKTEVEGALFVYSRTGEPFHNILIMNRLNTQNLMEPVVQGLDIQLQEPFMLYRNTQCDIYGIWFYNNDECIRIASALNQLVKKSPPVPKQPSQQVQSLPPQQPPPAAKVPINIINNNTSSNGMDIFSMLSKAQEDYFSGKNGSRPPAPAAPNTEPAPAPAGPPQTVLDFFAKASSSSSKPPVSQPPGLVLGTQSLIQHLPPKESNDPNIKPILQRLMSNPVHSVEHIEKQQQRSVTPQQAEPPQASVETKSTPKEQKRTGFKLKPMKEASKQKNQVENLNSPQNATTAVTNGLNFLRLSPANTGVSTQQVKPVILQSPRTPGGPNPILDRSDVTPKQPALMPPVMFTSSPDGGSQSTPQPPDLSGQLMGNHSPPPRPEPLTRNQLMQAFHYLLKNDPEFVNMLHEAYVKSFAEIVP